MNRALLFPTILLLVLGIVAYVLSLGSSAALSGERRPIVFANADEIKTLDVGKMSWANDIRTAMALWEGLLSYHPTTLELLPGVAQKWDISPDGKTYTFHLRKEAKWSNGDPVRSQDFAFAWKRVLTPATGADYITLLHNIAGAEAYTNALAEGKPVDFASVGVKTPDDHTLVVTLANPVSYFLDLCAFPPLFPLHEKAMESFLADKAKPETGYDARWTRPPHLVTNGAFRLAEWQFKRHLLLVPNERYWDRSQVRAPAIKIMAYDDPRAAILAYTDGTVDALSFVPKPFGEQLLKDQKEGRRRDVHFRPVFGTYYYIFNCTRKPFDDARVRKALSLAVDRDLLTREITRMGEAPVGVIVPPKSIPGYQGPSGLGMDVAKAKELLAEAGFPEGRGFPTVEILYNTEAQHDKVAQAIGAMWKKHLNVNVAFKGIERATFGTDRRSNNFAIARGGWYGDYTDPTTWLDLARSTDGNNDGKYNNPKFDELLNKAAMEPDAAKRFAILREAERMLVEEEFPFLPLYQYADGYMFDPDKLGGIDLNVRLLTQFKWLHRK